MPPMTPCYRRNDDVLTRRIADETLLVPLRGRLADMQSLFALDPVAEFIWQRLDGRHTLAQIGAALVEAFAVQADEAEADLREFVAALVEAGLAAEVPPDG
jgi:hypothetical protein